MCLCIVFIQNKMRFQEDIITKAGCASSPDILTTDADLKACGRCKLCRENLNTSTTFTSSVTHETFSIEDKKIGIDLACTTRNVIYLITCD